MNPPVWHHRLPVAFFSSSETVESEKGRVYMAKFRVHEFVEGVEANRFEMTGTLLEGEILPGMFLQVWPSRMLYYPYHIVAVQPATGTTPRDVRLTFESEIGEECLLRDMPLRDAVCHTSEREPCLDI